MEFNSHVHYLNYVYVSNQNYIFKIREEASCI